MTAAICMPTSSLKIWFEIFMWLLREFKITVVYFSYYATCFLSSELILQGTTNNNFRHDPRVCKEKVERLRGSRMRNPKKSVWIARKRGFMRELVLYAFHRSPNLTSCDFYLLGFIKNRVFVAPLPADLLELRNRFEAAGGTTDCERLINIWK